MNWSAAPAFSVRKTPAAEIPIQSRFGLSASSAIEWVIRPPAPGFHLSRVAVTVVDPQNPYKWISVTGRAELTHDDADAQIDRLAKKYIDKDVYPWHKPEEQRVKVRISPERIDATGIDG